jgi:hypothetical protein
VAVFGCHAGAGGLRAHDEVTALPHDRRGQTFTGMYAAPASLSEARGDGLAGGDTAHPGNSLGRLPWLAPADLRI